MKNEKHVITILNKKTNNSKRIILNEDEIVSFSTHEEVDDWELDRIKLRKKPLENENLNERLENIEKTLDHMHHLLIALLVVLIIALFIR